VCPRHLNTDSQHRLITASDQLQLACEPPYGMKFVSLMMHTRGLARDHALAETQALKRAFAAVTLLGSKSGPPVS
jgi:hypothetical protein